MPTSQARAVVFVLTANANGRLLARSQSTVEDVYSLRCSHICCCTIFSRRLREGCKNICKVTEYLQIFLLQSLNNYTFLLMLIFLIISFLSVFQLNIAVSLAHFLTIIQRIVAICKTKMGEKVSVHHNWSGEQWDWPLQHNDGIVKVIHTKDKFQIELEAQYFTPNEIEVCNGNVFLFDVILAKSRR